MPDLQHNAASARRVFRVGELMQGLRELLEEEVGQVWVVGEISNLHRARSGHCYFTLKDDRAQIRAALFRGTAARLPFDPEEGLEVVVLAEASVYAERGDLQLIVRQLEPRGQGALQLAFEQLRARLEAEGLFDEARKRPLPDWPRRVGIVTSPTGAAVRDVIHVAERRLPAQRMLLAPTRVQGAEAEREVAEALARVGRAPDVDVVLLVRGGGSLEDLQAFNTEMVARAIRACPVPVVAGVGHEVDVTIADLAADARAATPSAAAALAVPDGSAALARLGRLRERLVEAAHLALLDRHQQLTHMSDLLRAHSPKARLVARRDRQVGLRRDLDRMLASLLPAQRSRLSRAAGRLAPAVAPLPALLDARLSGLTVRLQHAALGDWSARRSRLAAAAARLDALSPLAVLGRGFAIVQRADDGSLLRRAAQAAPGDDLRVRLAEGELRARVLESD